MSNEQNQNPNNSNLNDYEIDVPEKKGFWARILEKITNKSPKALTDGKVEKTPVTNTSISSMWSLRSLRAALVNTLETARKAIFPSRENETQNGFDTVVIGREDSKNPEKNEDLGKEQPAMAKVIFPKDILHTSKNITIEPLASNFTDTSDSNFTSSQGGLQVANIDASAATKNAQSTLTVGTIHVADQPELEDEDLVVEKPEEQERDS